MNEINEKLDIDEIEHQNEANNVRKAGWDRLRNKLVIALNQSDESNLWIRRVLINLFNRIQTEYDLLNEYNTSSKRHHLFSVAWHTRNLMELAIYCQYVALSEKNLKQLYDDAGNDGLDLLDAHTDFAQQSNAEDEWLEQLENTKQQLKENAQSNYAGTPDGTYTKIVKIAKELGNYSEYVVTNKTLSKFIHPTAYSIIASDEHIIKFKNVFVGLGYIHFIHAHSELEKAVDKYIK